MTNGFFSCIIPFVRRKRIEKIRGVAQMVERHVRDVEAEGSNPFTPTTSRQAIKACRDLFLQIADFDTPDFLRQVPVAVF